MILGKGATRDPAFLAGRMSPQDEASQLVVEFLDPQPGESILDTCAAPGTKTMAIADHLVLRIFGSARSPDVSWPGG